MIDEERFLRDLGRLIEALERELAHYAEEPWPADDGEIRDACLGFSKQAATILTLVEGRQADLANIADRTRTRRNENKP